MALKIFCMSNMFGIIWRGI